MKSHESPFLFQVGTVGCLLQGIHEGEIALKILAEHGDCGIGTFNSVDGELVALDGKFYRIDGDGKAALADLSRKTFFAMVTTFKEDFNFSIMGLKNLKELTEILDKNIQSKNYIYMIRMDGEFKNMQARSLKENPKPYKPLAEMLPKIQTRFEFHETSGTMIGTYFPKYLSDINVAGYHFHYMDHPRKIGGHVFELEIKKAIVHVCKIQNFAMHLPNNELFKNTIFEKDEKALHFVERGDKK